MSVRARRDGDVPLMRTLVLTVLVAIAASVLGVLVVHFLPGGKSHPVLAAVIGSIIVSVTTLVLMPRRRRARSSRPCRPDADATAGD